MWKAVEWLQSAARLCYWTDKLGTIREQPVEELSLEFVELPAEQSLSRQCSYAELSRWWLYAKLPEEQLSLDKPRKDKLVWDMPALDEQGRMYQPWTSWGSSQRSSCP
jgi:hypothetical protein